MSTADIVFAVFAAGFICAMIVGSIVIAFIERKRWNKGVCPRCGNKWKFLTKDTSTGETFWTCDDPSHKPITISMTYNFLQKFKK